MPENVIALFALIGLVALVVVTALTVITRYKVAKPNQAFIVTGRKGKTSGDLSGQKVVTGGGVFVVPFVQQLSVLDLSRRRSRSASVMPCPRRASSSTSTASPSSRLAATRSPSASRPSASPACPRSAEDHRGHHACPLRCAAQHRRHPHRGADHP